MNLVSAEINDRSIARSFGIEAYTRGAPCDSFLGNQEMIRLCSGYNYRMLKVLIGAFVDGWNVQSRLCGK
jgi:hypothetical protein